MTIPVDYAQTNWIFSGTGLPTGAQVTMGWNISAYGGDAADLAEDVHVAFASNVMVHLSDTISLIGTLAKFGPDATGPSALHSATTGGGDTSDSGYPGACALVSKSTSDGGRAGRGRMYLPGIPEAAIDPSGGLDSGKRSQLQTDVDAMIADLVLLDIGPVVLHQAGAPLTTPSPIISLSVQGRVATQRRRNRR